MTTYEKIKSLCEREGFPISSIGEKIPSLRITKASISGWKKGAAPRPDKIKAIADFFGVSIEFLTDDTATVNVVNGAVAPVAITSGHHNTVTLTNGGTHTRELSEIETELLKICEKLDTRKKALLLAKAYEILESEEN